MVSGFLTSPQDQERIFSGDARPMQKASKSSMPVVCFIRFRNSFTIVSPLQVTENRSSVLPYSRSSSMSMPSERISRTSTLNDSGMPASMR